MKKRISTRAVCLLVAVCILVGALTVSAINGSPYENLKTAVINALFYENFTMEGEFTIHVDGQLREREWMRHYFGDESRLQISGSETHRAPGDTRPVHNSERTEYSTRYFRINPTFAGDGSVQWYSVNLPWNNNFMVSQSLGYEMFGIAGRNSNHLRLAELVVDLFVGDLKNNLYTSSHGDGRRINGAITGNQLPEMVRLVIDIAIDEQLRWANTNRQREDYVDVLDIPMRSLTIDRIQGHADIDSNGNLLYINVMGSATVETIFGDTYVIEIGGFMRFSEIGTTMLDSPFPGANEIFDEFFDTLRGHNLWHRQAFFTLDEHGNIDVDSLTHTWPQVQRTTLESNVFSSYRGF